MSNSQLNKLKAGVVNATEVTDTHVSMLCKAFANHLSANRKIPKTQLSNMIRLGAFFLMDFLGSSVRAMLQIPGIIKSVSRGKSIPKALLGTGSSLANIKINIPLPFMVLGLTLTNNE